MLRHFQRLRILCVGGACTANTGFWGIQGLIMSKISDNALSKMRIARAYVQILCILEDRSEASVSLASIGNCEIRMFVGSKAHSDGMSLFWLELLDYDAKTSVDSFSCHKIEDAVAVFDDFIAQAGRLNGTKNAVLN
jgi:hypothetical protein